MKAALLSAVFFISSFLAAGTCRADEWARLQGAQQRAQQATTAAGSLCSQQAAARTQITSLSDQIATSINTYQQRLQDSLITDVQSDHQRLAPLFQSFQNKASALSSLYQPTRLIPGPIESAPGFSSGQIAVTPEVMAATRQMVDHAQAVHDAVEELMEDNEPVMSFAPKSSYALWMALANNKQNPAWYQNRDQLHVRVQDNMDQLMRQAYSVYHGFNYSSPTSADIRTIYLRFVDMRTIWNQGSVRLAAGATQEIVDALNAYPGVVRQHRTTLTQEAEGWATQAETKLAEAKAACTALAISKAETAARLGGTSSIKPGLLKPGSDKSYKDVLLAEKTSKGKG